MEIGGSDVEVWWSGALEGRCGHAVSDVWRYGALEA